MMMALLSAFIGGEEAIAKGNIGQVSDVRSIRSHEQNLVDEGLVGSGQLPADTIDFLGDTLGSFSSLKIAPGSWKRVGDHYEGILWTLPDRGRNDPAAKLFFDYPARLNRFRVRFAAGDGHLTLTPDGGLQLRDFRGRPFTGADPDSGTTTERGILLPAPADGTGMGKISLDAESLQFTRDGHFYIGDEYTANIYYFDRSGCLHGVIRPPAAVVPMADGRPYFGSLKAPDTGRRNNQGPEGLSVSPDGNTLIVALQSALVQDSATGNPSGRINSRVLLYDIRHTPTPSQPVAHYVVQLPAYDKDGKGHVPERTAAQSEILALDDHRFLMLARDAAGLGADPSTPIVYKKILLVDVSHATNLAGLDYESGTVSVLQNPDSTALKAAIVPAAKVELIDMVNPVQLARFGLSIDKLSEKWEAMDLVSTLEPDHPTDYFLFVGNDNDFIARYCRMSGQSCNSDLDNDNRLLVYRVRLPAPL